MNRLRMHLIKDHYCLFHVAIRSNSTAARTNATSDSFAAPPSLPKHILEHALSWKYLKFEDGFQERYCLDYFGKLLFKNLRLEWRKFVEESGHLHAIEDALRKNSFDAMCSKEDALMRVNQLTESHKKPVTLICSAADNEPLGQRIVIAEKVQSQRSHASEIGLSHLEFTKRLYNHPSRVKVANSPSEDRKAFYIDGDASFEINNTRIIYPAEESTNHKKLMPLPKTAVTFINLYGVFFSILYDALMERNSGHYLLLQQNLIPVKVMVICESSCVQDSMSQLANEVCDMVMSWGITCWNGHERQWTASDADSIGCLFTIVVKDTFPKDGVLFLRSIATTLAMHVHVTQLYKVLQRYLHNKHATTDD